jgi:transposase
MWTSENRPKYNRDKLRYPSDLTDEEWSHVAPLIPPARRGGRKREVDVREVVNGIMYVLSTGSGAMFPKTFHPRARSLIILICGLTTALESIHQALYVKCREAMEREASPTACIIDSQSVKGAEKGGAASTRAATMRARRSKARSVTSSSTP